jgi:hypothetical protein
MNGEKPAVMEEEERWQKSLPRKTAVLGGRWLDDLSRCCRTRSSKLLYGSLPGEEAPHSTIMPIQSDKCLGQPYEMPMVKGWERAKTRGPCAGAVAVAVAGAAWQCAKNSMEEAHDIL